MINSLDGGSEFRAGGHFFFQVKHSREAVNISRVHSGNEFILGNTTKLALLVILYTNI